MSRNSIPFTKMQGLGNDYIYINTLEHPVPDPAAFSRRWSDRRTGIGSDGLILIGGSQRADFSMRIFNADGSEARMCGNGARCVGKYLHDKGLTDKTEISLETLSGIKTLTLLPDAQGAVSRVSVEMGAGLPLAVRRAEGVFLEEEIEAAGRVFRGSAIDVGNPHLVLLVEDALAAPVAAAGPELERHPMFPDRANIEFAQVLDERHIRLRVWERGSGITAACGTGACATVVAAAMAGKVSPQGCSVLMDGGVLEVSWDPRTRRVTMTGPAETVFEGTIGL
ncbi:MAG: diaminopimelate epimerase [Bacteroidales bacterium]|nr:diaminopimelate epimerase [Bacteroidales bacterium]